MEHKEILLQTIKESKEAIDKAERELAELERPKLRHGDYGLHDDDRNGWLTLERNNQLELFGDNTGSGMPVETIGDISESGKPYRLGNIFDDIKAKTEKLESFVAKSYDDTDNRLEFQPRCDSNGKTIIRLIATEGEDVSVVDYTQDQAQEIADKLTRVVATARTRNHEA